MEKIKVIHFQVDEHLGGIESFLLNLYKEIDRDCIQFDFVTESVNPALGYEFNKLGAKIYKVSSYKNVFQYKKDIRDVINLGYDVVHIHKNSAANIIPFVIANQKGIPIISHSHNTRPSIGKITSVLHKMNQKKLYELSDYHLACSTEGGKWLYGNNPYNVVKNGIQTKKFVYDNDIALEKRKEFHISRDSMVVGHIGRFTEQKNQSYLVDIFAKIIEVEPKAILMLVGEGELMKNIHDKVESLGLKDRVIFTGNRNDIPELLTAMDAFVMPSLYEGLPIVGVEAQASGVKTYLSDSISKETEMSDAVIWFSNTDGAEKISSIILSTYKENRDRTLHNSSVCNAGYDMSETAKFMFDQYKELQEKNGGVKCERKTLSH